jgi:hypothetical protein
MIHGGPTVSADFHFAGSHTLIASTWKQPGSLDDVTRYSMPLIWLLISQGVIVG